MSNELGQEYPSLKPLENSGSATQFDDELRRLVLDLFADLLASESYDVNLLAMPHLGSMSLVLQEIAGDGLYLMRAENSDALTRYMFRAWRGLNRNGRGLYFLRLYLRILFGEGASAHQIHKSATTDDENSVRNDWYMPHLDDPDLSLDGSWRLGEVVEWRTTDFIYDEMDVYPSNRIRVTLDYQSVDPKSVRGLADILRRILHVRLVPVIELTSAAVVDAAPYVYETNTAGS